MKEVAGGGLTLLPPIITAWMPREGAHPRPRPWDARGGWRALVSPGQAINLTTTTLFPNARRPGACRSAFYLYLQWK